MIRKHKLYLRPKQIYEKERINEENLLKNKYALSNKTEIWKTLAKVNYLRHRAKELTKKPIKEQDAFFNKLRALGLNTKGTADVLGLKVEDLLERRLSTIVVKKKIANTAKQARQMVVHKKILVDGKVLNSPSYLVPVLQEDKISVKKKVKKPKEVRENKVEEIKEENIGDKND